MEFKGLSKEEVEIRIKENKVNKVKVNEAKEYFKIFLNSFFNFYDIILYIVAIIFIVYSSTTKDVIPISKYGFLNVVIINALISFITNVKAKRKLSKLNLINKSKYTVIRDEKETEINDDDIVEDDIIILKGGDVVPADIEVLEGTLKVDESVLTGESDLILKNVNDTLLGGSSITSGYIVGRVTKVGKDSYINKIKCNLIKVKKKKTPLEKFLNTLILIMIFLMIPAALTVFLKMLSLNSWNLSKEVISKTSTIIVGMIPIGMILLSSITLTNSVIKLSNKNVLTKNIYSIENLSKIDTLALDKTGTITTNKLKVEDIVKLDDSFDESKLLSYLCLFNEDNKTSSAIKEYLNSKNVNKIDLNHKEIVEFSSETKHSKVILNDNNTLYFGAIEMLSNEAKTKELAVKYQNESKRVLLFKENDKDLALITLSDELQKGIKESIANFNKLGIDIKVISGDNLNTVKAIAGSVGIDNSKCISLENKSIEEVEELALEYNIFTRSTPLQKEAIIKTLEKNNHKVCYIGDGINDLLSLKNATCSISFENASSAAKNISDFILMDNDFNSLDRIIYEGRRVINNIERSLLLFLTKNIFFFLNAITSIFFSSGMLIDIESVYIFEWITVAFGGFLLSIENNIPKKEDDHLIKKILINSSLSGLYLFLPILILGIINNVNPTLIGNPFGIATLLVTFEGLIIFLGIIYPFNKYTGIVYGVVGVACILLLILIPSLFLNNNFLISASSIKDQLALLGKGLFNYEIFKEFNLHSYLYLIFAFIGSSLIYLGIKWILKMRNKE